VLAAVFGGIADGALSRGQRKAVPPRRGSLRAIVSRRGVPAGIFASIAVLSAANVFTAYMPVLGEQHAIGPAVIGALLALRRTSEATTMSIAFDPLTIAIDDADIYDLKHRLAATRWPQPAPGPPWSQGTDLAFLQELIRYWREDFDWRAQERELNAFAHYRAKVDGVMIHFVRERAPGGDGIPLILTHGWPSNFVEYLPLVPLLTDPAAHGIEGAAFDVVLPSLPGYGFSDRPEHPITYRDIAHLWHRLMRGLGYRRYGAGGSDFGSGVATFMALDDPEPLIGIHLTNLELSPDTGPGSQPLSDAEHDYLEQGEKWDAAEGGYTAIQSTKPQTLAYALNDSPAGLAAWILEKWRAWSDSGGELDSRFSRDFLLTIVSLFWFTQTMPTSIRDYSDNRRWQGEPRLRPDDRVLVPTAIARFAQTFVPEGDMPLEWAERLYDVRRWTPMPRGGHFAAAEEPGLVAADVAAAFAAFVGRDRD
jgi:pimeloyl-ACP methyl ester carboxylesterase